MAANYQMLFELNAALGGGFTSAFTQGSQQIDNMKAKLDALNATGSTGDIMGGISSALAATGVMDGLQAVYDILEECVQASIEFESAMAGVAKTVDMTAGELDEMASAVMRISTEIPVTTTELANIMEVAGQLGIQKENLLDFATVMSQLATATSMSADEAATMLSQFANITQMAPSLYSNLASTVVELGNNYATTEQKIIEMGQGIAASGTLAGMSEADIMGLAAAVTSLGIAPQAGSTSMSKLISMINMAVETGDGLDQFASVAGMSAAEFARAWGDDAANALAVFISGLNDVERNGASATVILNELGITETRMQRMILSLAGSGDLMSNAIRDANAAFRENTALTAEAEKRYATVESRLTMMRNAANNVMISIGDALAPVVGVVADSLTHLLEPIAEFIEANPALVQGLTAFAGVLGVAAGAMATYAAVTKLAAAANVLFGGSIPGIGIILGIAGAVGTLVFAVGALTDAYDRAHPSFETLDAEYDELNKKAKEQKEIIELAEEYKTLIKEIDELESSGVDTTITVNAEPGSKVSVSGDLVVDKDQNVYVIDAETGNIVSVAKDLVTDKDGNTYLINASAGQKVSVRGDLVTEKDGNTYVIDARKGRRVSVRNDLVVDQDGTVWMIDAKTGNKVSVKYDLVTEADGTQYVINAVTGQKVSVRTDLVYNNSEEELRQVINATAGTKVSVSGQLVIDKDGNTYVINARTGNKVSVSGDLVTDKDGTVYLIDAKKGEKVSVSKDLVTDKDGQVVTIDGKAGETVSVYSLITDTEGKAVTITATVNAEGAAEELNELTTAEDASAAAAEKLAEKRRRLREVTELLRTSSGGMISATDDETDALYRQVEAYEAVARARKDEYTSKALRVIQEQSGQYVAAVKEEKRAADSLERSQTQQTVIQEFLRAGDAAGYVKSEYMSLFDAVSAYKGDNWLTDQTEEAIALQNRYYGLETLINTLTGEKYDFSGSGLSGMGYVINHQKFDVNQLSDSWSGAIASAAGYADTVEANGKIQSDFVQNLVDGVVYGTLTYEDLERQLTSFFSSYENGGELVADIMTKVKDGVDAARAAADGSGEAAQGEAETTVSAIDGILTKIDDLRQAYEAAKASAKEALGSRFGLFDRAGLSEQKRSVTDMRQGLESQVEYWNLYNDNLQAVLDKGLAPQIAMQLADGSQESADTLAVLATASKEDIQAINEAFGEVEESRDTLASTIADMKTNFSSALADMKADLDSFISELDGSPEAAQAAASTILAYVDGLQADGGDASEAAQTIATNVSASLAAIPDVDINITYHYKTDGAPPADAGVGTVEPHHAIGTDYAAAGLALVGEEGPELVMMQGGEKVLTAHETATALSAASAGYGGNVISVNFSPTYNVSGGNAAEVRAVLNEHSASMRDQVQAIMEDIVTDRMRVSYA